MEKKKLLILGGAGHMGSFSVEMAVKCAEFSKITIGDYNVKTAKKVVARFDDDRLQVEKVDANKHEMLVEIMKKHDIVISAIGPFYHFGPLVAKAAIEAKRVLIDICDDHGPTKKVMEMHDKAVEAKVPIFLGFGWTPGISNLLLKHGMGKLDKDSDVRANIAWGGGAKDSEGLAVVMHVLYACDGNVPSFIDGKFVDIPAVSGTEKIRFPAPLNELTVFHCGHPEPVTIPKYFDNLKECTLKGGLTPEWNNGFTSAIRSYGLTKGKWKTYVAKFVHSIESVLESGGVAASSARVDLHGKRNGEDVHTAYATPSIEMGILTGYLPVIMAQLYANDKLPKVGGVFPPETQDDELILGELEKVGIKMTYDDEGKTPRVLGVPKGFKPGFFSMKLAFEILFFVIFVVFLFIIFLFIRIFLF